MIRYQLVCVLVGLCALPVAAQSDLTPVAIGFQTTIQSQVLGEARDVFVYLPANHDRRDETFPVMVLLDGRSNFHHTTAAVEYLSRAHLMPEMIVVGIPNTNRTRDFTVNRGQWLERRSGGGADAFLDFIENEVLVWVNGRFRTAPHRTLVGHSLGASLASYALVSRPDLFHAFILLSPAISADERQLADGAVAMSEHVKTGLRGLDSRHRRVFASMSGVEDPAWVEDWRTLRRVIRRHAPDSLEFHEDDRPGESHSTIPLAATGPALRWLFEGWDGVDAARSDDIEVLEAHFAELTRRMGFAVPVPEGLVNTMGYRLLQAGRLEQALVTFRRNVALHPESANVHDSLGEGLETAGDLDAAAQSYAVAVEKSANGDLRNREVFEENLRRVTELLAVADTS